MPYNPKSRKLITVNCKECNTEILSTTFGNKKHLCYDCTKNYQIQKSIIHKEEEQEIDQLLGYY